jgi:leader peptidase (prepilin peptidase)/N-methyltransferase
VETANGLFFLAIFLRTGPELVAVPVAVVVSMTVALIYIDADIQILPDAIDLPGIAVGIAIGALHGAERAPSLVLASSVTDSLIGAAIGGGVLWAVALAYRWLRKIEGMGLGDVKMLAMIGSASGPHSLFAVVMLASVAGSVAGLGVMAVNRRADMQFALPFGVFLGGAFLVVLFFGRQLYAILPALNLWP